MIFDSSQDRQYPSLVLLSGGLVTLAKNTPKKDSQKTPPAPVPIEPTLDLRKLGENLMRWLKAPGWAYPVVLAIAFSLYHDNGQFNAINDRFDAVIQDASNTNQRLATVEGQLSVLIGGHFLNSAARDAKAGDLNQAVEQLATASNLITQASQQKVAAPVAFFSDALETLDKIDASTTDPNLLNSAFAARMQLGKLCTSRSILVQRNRSNGG